MNPDTSASVVLNRAQRRALQSYIKRKTKLQLRHIKAVERKRNAKMSNLMQASKA